MKQELKVILDRGACVAIQRCEIPSGATIFCSQGIQTIRTDTHGNPKYKTGLVLMGHIHHGNGYVVK